MGRADEHRLAPAASDAAPQARSSRAAAHRVLELEPCALTAERPPEAAPTGAAEEDVVREDEIGRSSARSAAAFAST